jgi:hypothetical protein
VAAATIKLQMPPGVSSVSVNGISITVAKDGSVEVPASMEAELAAHGAVRPPVPEPKK